MKVNQEAVSIFDQFPQHIKIQCVGLGWQNATKKLTIEGLNLWVEYSIQGSTNDGLAALELGKPERFLLATEEARRATYLAECQTSPPLCPFCGHANVLHETCPNCGCG